MTLISAAGAPTARRRVLLTGFGPFPGVADNASARLVAALARLAQARHPGTAIECEILPTEWVAAPERLRALIAAINPDVVLSFGVARDAVGFRLEVQGRNVCHIAPDAAGLAPLASILCDEGPAAYAASAPIARLFDRLTERGHPVSISNDAGGYLCNAVYYHGLDCASAGGAQRCVAFVHIPADLSRGPLTFEAALAGALEILDVCLEAVDHSDGECRGVFGAQFGE